MAYASKSKTVKRDLYCDKLKLINQNNLKLKLERRFFKREVKINFVSTIL